MVKKKLISEKINNPDMVEADCNEDIKDDKLVSLVCENTKKNVEKLQQKKQNLQEARDLQKQFPGFSIYQKTIAYAGEVYPQGEIGGYLLFRESPMDFHGYPSSEGGTDYTDTTGSVIQKMDGDHYNFAFVE